MQPCFALLLDAGFLRYELGESSKPCTATDVIAFVDRVRRLDELAGIRLHRVYFYDARPISGIDHNPIDGSKVDFGATQTAANGKAMHSALSSAPFFALRFGDLYQEGWRLKKKVLKKSAALVPPPMVSGAAAPAAPGVTVLKPAIGVAAGDVEPNIRQKGVDMRIGLDIANLTLKRQVQVIVLVTADSDFIPAMKFARREGAQLFLITLGHGIKDGMREHADLVIEKV